MLLDSDKPERVKVTAPSGYAVLSTFTIICPSEQLPVQVISHGLVITTQLFSVTTRFAASALVTVFPFSSDRVIPSSENARLVMTMVPVATAEGIGLAEVAGVVVAVLVGFALLLVVSVPVGFALLLVVAVLVGFALLLVVVVLVGFALLLVVSVPEGFALLLALLLVLSVAVAVAASVACVGWLVACAEFVAAGARLVGVFVVTLVEPVSVLVVGAAVAAFVACVSVLVLLLVVVVTVGVAVTVAVAVLVGVLVALLCFDFTFKVIFLLYFLPLMVPTTLMVQVPTFFAVMVPVLETVAILVLLEEKLTFLEDKLVLMVKVFPTVKTFLLLLIFFNFRVEAA